jgi:hypothetical protein
MMALTRAETGIPITERRHTAIFTRNYSECRAEAGALAAEIALSGKRGRSGREFLAAPLHAEVGPHLRASTDRDVGEIPDAGGRRAP